MDEQNRVLAGAIRNLALAGELIERLKTGLTNVVATRTTIRDAMKLPMLGHQSRWRLS